MAKHAKRVYRSSKKRPHKLPLIKEKQAKTPPAPRKRAAKDSPGDLSALEQRLEDKEL